MEKHNSDLLEELAGSHPELAALREDHILFEKQIEKLESKPFLTPTEEMSMKQLKKQKLDNKTKMHEMLEQIQRGA